MKSRILIVCLAGILLLFGWNGLGNSQQFAPNDASRQDSADIAINYKTAYPGSETWIEIQMKNPVEVSGYQFLLMMGGVDVAHFLLRRYRRMCGPRRSIRRLHVFRRGPPHLVE